MDVEKEEDGEKKTVRGDAQLAQGDLAAQQVGGHRRRSTASSTSRSRGDFRRPGAGDPLHRRGQPGVPRRCCSCPPRSRSTCSSASTSGACACTSSASSSWTTARRCCRRYLRFVKGVVDSTDLPLNISRELLQHEPAAGADQEQRHARVLKALDDMKTDDYDKYVAFFKEFGADPQGGRRPRLGQPREDRRPAAVRVAEDAGGPVHDAGEVRRGDARGPEGDLLPDRRGARAAGAFALPGGVPRQGPGRAAADRPDRRVHDLRPAARTRARSSRPPTAASRDGRRWTPPRRRSTPSCSKR